MNKNKSELRKIPFIGPNIEQDLLNIGISRIADLKGKDPEELYRMDCEFKGRQEDLCQLYVFRMAVYYADTVAAAWAFAADNGYFNFRFLHCCRLRNFL